MVFGNEGKCRAGDRVDNPQPLPDTLSQTGLARAEFALQADDVARLEQETQARAKAVRLGGAVADKVESVFVKNGHRSATFRSILYTDYE